MNEAPPGREAAAAAMLRRPPWVRRFCTAENWLAAGVLVLIAVLPITEIVLRRVAGTGIKASAPFVQHFTLLVSLLGGAIAAREGRLLSLSTLTHVLGARARAAATLFSGAVAAAISVLLAVAGWEMALSTPLESQVAYGIPVRAFQYVIPAGFLLVALRLVWLASAKWPGRLGALALAATCCWLGADPPVDPARLLWPALGLLGAATMLGAPIFVALGGAAMILFWSEGRPVSLVPLEHYDLVVNPILPSLPLFTLAGYFLAEGGASRRLVRVFQAWCGHFRGGPAIVTALVCAFFTSFTGASGVTILALGGLLLPVLLAARYAEKPALGLLTGAGSLGLLFPPCLPLILYAVIAQSTLANLELPPDATRHEVTINGMFLAGIGPGLLLVLLTAWWGRRLAPADAPPAPFNRAEALAALREAKWELLLPLVVLGALFTGWATPVEAAALGALYALFTQTVLHRDLTWTRDVPRVLTECALLIGGVLLILGVAMGLTKYLIFADAPTHALGWIQQGVQSKWTFLLLLNVFLLLVGCLMDVYSAIVVIVPLIVPMGVAYGVHPLHLGIIFLANLELGFLTPPVGMNLFLSSYRFGRPMGEVSRATLPMLFVLLAGVLLITYFPPLTTLLPQLFSR